MRERLDHAGELTDRLSGPLARIQLAASELDRDAMTPRHRELLSRIARAVVELDGLAQAIDGVLRPREGAGAVADLYPVLEDIHERLAPAVTARGLVWLQPEPASATVFGNPARVRHAAIALIEGATAEATPELGLRLRVFGEKGLYGVGLDLESAGQPLDRERIEGATRDARSLALSRGGSFDLVCDGEGARLTVWWPADARVAS